MGNEIRGIEEKDEISLTEGLVEEISLEDVEEQTSLNYGGSRDSVNVNNGADSPTTIDVQKGTGSIH